ncbi:pilus assembly protein PilO [Niallia sp. FSL R7-0271]|uniref:pilus assembly protein PilO n=1 Tax=Niallia sp. FSL R7-0271 TaxID=2921678 RepID=UPI0030F7EDB3
MRLGENRSLFLFLLSALLILGAGAYVYFAYLQPLSNQVDIKETELQLVEQQVTILDSKIKAAKESTNTSTVQLQQQVPVKRLLEQALLEIEKAEIISDTNLIEIKLNGTDSDETVTEEDLTTADKAIDDANKQAGDESENDAAASETTLPNGIKKTAINILGEANTYFDLEKLLEELQSSKRIMDIDSLKITGTKEVMEVEDNDQKIEFEMTVSIYYYPELEDLINDLPSMESPASADRKNPFAGVSTEEDE